MKGITLYSIEEVQNMVAKILNDNQSGDHEDIVEAFVDELAGKDCDSRIAFRNKCYGEKI